MPEAPQVTARRQKLRLRYKDRIEAEIAATYEKLRLLHEIAAEQRIGMTKSESCVNVRYRNPPETRTPRPDDELDAWGREKRYKR